MKKTLFIMVFLFLNVISFAENSKGLEGISDEIAMAIRTGNAKELAKYFASSVDLNLPGYEGIYSKAQGEQIMKSFFSKYPPSSFTIIHQGASKDGSQYYIGSYVSSNKKFRTYFLLKKSGEIQYLQQLRFEEE